MSHLSRPEAHGLDELSAGIPWRVALQQRLPTLSRLLQGLQSCRSKIYYLSANGYCPTLSLSQPRGCIP